MPDAIFVSAQAASNFEQQKNKTVNENG